MEAEKRKRRMGDRKDGYLLRDLDGMHFIVPLIYPNRCDNEAFLSERIDLTNADAYLAKRNVENPEFQYTVFHLIVAAMIKTITLRPKMNRFIANKNMYQRNEVSASFVVKKQFSDEAQEGLAFVHATEKTTLETIHQDIYRQVIDCRSGKGDSSSDSMDVLNRMPRFLSKFLVWIITRLDVHGKVPNFLIATDPYYSSIVLTNLGSIKLHSGYHHLTNWGTNSVFVAIGAIKKRPFYDDDGNATMKNSIDLGLTIDERIADGYYYSKTVKLLRHLLENPELLERPACEEAVYTTM
ncbi:MAG: 2-oxo acid dehydrogenase subunit E2 [Oscillospiraceae bacterium]|nr:2-oxo acid dehydrogenase subunit E2 [Oscillospiraceae bacterium]